MTEPMTEEELQEMFDETEEIHTLWYALNDYLEKHNRSINTLSGYDDMRCMDAFCEEHPDVIRVHVDDEHHCNSYVYIIPHEGKTRYMGATVVFVPQCCNVMNQFFLYPEDNRGLLNACLRLEDIFQKKGDKRFVSDGDLNEDVKDTKD
jgi:hypothetical protein